MRRTADASGKVGAIQYPAAPPNRRTPDQSPIARGVAEDRRPAPSSPASIWRASSIQRRRTVMGASIKAAQKQMGHSTASQTLDVYGHLFPDELPALAERLEQTRTAALAERLWPERGPAVVPLAGAAGE
jgi:hypothetical protein